MPQMSTTTKNIFANIDKFVTVKRINVIIEIIILTTKVIKSSMQHFIRQIRKQGLDGSIDLFPMIYTLFIEDILPNVRNNT